MFYIIFLSCQYCMGQWYEDENTNSRHQDGLYYSIENFQNNIINDSCQFNLTRLQQNSKKLIKIRIDDNLYGITTDSSKALHKAIAIRLKGIEYINVENTFYRVFLKDQISKILVCKEYNFVAMPPVPMQSNTVQPLECKTYIFHSSNRRPVIMNKKNLGLILEKEDPKLWSDFKPKRNLEKVQNKYIGLFNKRH